MVCPSRMLVAITPVASVMMKGGIFKYATPMPLNKPIKIPTPRVRSTPTSALFPIAPVIALMNTADAVMIAATERSMPPVSMTRP